MEEKKKFHRKSTVTAKEKRENDEIEERDGGDRIFECF